MNHMKTMDILEKKVGLKILVIRDINNKICNFKPITTNRDFTIFVDELETIHWYLNFYEHIEANTEVIGDIEWRLYDDIRKD